MLSRRDCSLGCSDNWSHSDYYFLIPSHKTVVEIRFLPVLPRSIAKALARQRLPRQLELPVWRPDYSRLPAYSLFAGQYLPYLCAASYIATTFSVGELSCSW